MPTKTSEDDSIVQDLETRGETFGTPKRFVFSRSKCLLLCLRDKQIKATNFSGRGAKTGIVLRYQQIGASISEIIWYYPQKRTSRHNRLVKLNTASYHATRRSSDHISSPTVSTL